MFRYKLRTLLIVLAVVPPVLGSLPAIHRAYWDWRWQAATRAAAEVTSLRGGLTAKAAPSVQE